MTVKQGENISGPIIHLVRHAESEHKPRDGSHRVFEHISDPVLSPNGRRHCISRNDYLRCHAKYITHVLSSPLSRSLETAFLTLKAVTDNGVKVWAIPELQSFSAEPAGIGMNLAQLASRYNAEEDFPMETNCESDTNKNLKVTEAEEPSGKLDLRYMSADWNIVRCKTNGRWSWEHRSWRSGYLKGFLRALGCEGQSVEVVVVCHSSSIGLLTDGLILRGDELAFSSYIFDDFGNLQPITVSEVAHERERRAIKDQSRTLVDKNVSTFQSSECSKAKMKVESQEKDMKVESQEKDTKVESQEKDMKVESQEKDTKVESRENDAKIESQESDTKIESQEKDTKAESQENNMKVESQEKDMEVESQEKDVKVELQEKNVEVESQEKGVEVESQEKDVEVESQEKDAKVESQEKDAKVESQEKDTKQLPSLRTTTGKIRVKRAAEVASHRRLPRDRVTTTTLMEEELIVEDGSEKWPENESPQNFSKDLKKPVIEKAKILRKQKIQTRSEVIGRFRVQKKAKAERRTQFRKNFHMTLRSRFKGN